MEFDYIVVGAGAAGCAAAARLSERPACRVLLVEAGPDIVPEPASIRSPYPISHAVADFRWPDLAARIKAPLGDAPAAPPMPYLQGRVVGGGGSLMGMIALRGAPADYDAWRDEGAGGWGWEQVLESFRRLEDDHDFTGPLHGQGGPIPIRRHTRSAWSPFARAVGEAFEAAGAPFVADANGDFRDGHLAVPVSSLPDRRVSSATGYLTAEVRARPNLTLLPGAEVTAVLFDGRRATGVALGDTVYAARHVVLSAGALKTPALLMQSGVGPGEALRAVGIAPVNDLPGVGANLCNHPAIYLSAWLPAHARKPGGPFIFNALRYSSGLPDCPDSDMLMPVINRTGWHALGDAVASLGVCVYKSASRGRIALTRRDGRIVPDIDLGMFADPRDLARMVSGYRRAFGYLTGVGEALSGMRIFAPTNMRLMAQLAVPTFANGALARMMALTLEGPEFLRRRALREAGIDAAALMQDEDRLTEFVHRTASPMFHPAGSCRIGAPGDPAAVVDPRCRVIGVEGLSIADASVMPAIVRGNTNIPAIMIGEHVARMLREDEAR